MCLLIDPLQKEKCFYIRYIHSSLMKSDLLVIQDMGGEGKGLDNQGQESEKSHANKPME